MPGLAGPALYLLSPNRSFLQSSGLITIAAAVLFGGQAASAQSGSGAVDPDTIEPLIAGLGAESYATRERSVRRLIELAESSDEMGERVRSWLEPDSFPPQDLELYLSKQGLLRRLELRGRQDVMDRFVHDSSFNRGAVIGWEQFRSGAGDQLDARLVFAAAVRDRPEIGRILAGNGEGSISLPGIDTIDRHDVATWCVVLSVSSRRMLKVADVDTMRLAAMLRNPGSGPDAIRDHEQRVLSRLVERYITVAPIDFHDRMVIGLRYGCDSVIESDCRRVLDDPTESPSRIVTAMLAASKLDFSRAQIDRWIEGFHGDDRVSHVWRSMVPPKTTHRTQVRDVALALRLHRSGIDPRTRGFDAVVADPILVFRPYSLGFESDASRRQTHRSGAHGVSVSGMH